MDIVLCVARFLLGLALVFYIWWLAILSIASILIVFVARTFNLSTTHTIPAAEIAAEHRAWLARVRNAVPISRLEETHSENRGLAILERPDLMAVAQ